MTHDQIADEVWTAYSNFNTARRVAAVAFLEAATLSYEASLESYNSFPNNAAAHDHLGNGTFGPQVSSYTCSNWQRNGHVDRIS